MTITRLAQLTAETRVTTGIVYIPAANLSLPTISSTRAKTGTYSYKHNISGGAFGIGLSSPVSAYRMGYWLYIDSGGLFGNTVIASGAAAGNTFASTDYNMRTAIDLSGGTLSLLRPSGSGTHATLEEVTLPAQFSTLDTWFHVGVTHKMDELDGFYSIYVDGTQVLNYTGDTRLSRWSGSLEYQSSAPRLYGTGGISTNAGWSDAYVDDFFIDSYEGESDSPVPARLFLMVLPTGAGEDAEWTPLSGANYENVDENPHDGDASYNKALSSGLRDTFQFGNITVPVDHRIVAVIPSPYVRRLDSEVDGGISVHAFDGLTYEDSADIDLSMSYDSPAFARILLQPDGSVWNETDFNAMQFGYRSRGTF